MTKKNKWQKIAEEAEAQESQAEEQSQVEQEQDGGDDQQALEAELQQPLEHPDPQAALVAAEQERDALRSEVLRGRAELENLHKRYEKKISDTHNYAHGKIVDDLLPVIDSLERALEGEEPTDSAQSAMRDGMRLTLDLLEKALLKHGVKEISPAKGDPFNPEEQEAMAMQPDPDAKSNTVLAVLQKGYAINGRVLRAARVLVAA